MPLKAGSARKAITLVVLLALLGVLGVVVSNRWGSIGAPEATVAGRYSTEEQWIVAEIAQDIVEMASYASDQRRKTGGFDFVIDGPQGEPPSAKVSFLLPGGTGRLSHEVVIRNHVWSSEDYEPLAIAVLKGLGLEGFGAPGSTDETALAGLTNLRSRVMETQNQQVSARLRSSMLDADAHEDAALLLGALALREASGHFWDTRQTLCRMTAHLAFARALHGEGKSGISGRFSDVILAIGAGRAREGLAKLEDLKEEGGPSAARRAWLAALRLRITGDWRATTEPLASTLLEQLEYFRALRNALDAAAAFHFYESVESEPVPDWGWIAFASGFGTEVGAFAREGVEPEFREARDLWQRQHARPLGTPELARALSAPAQRCMTGDGPNVIVWGTWAAFLQRHTCQRALAIDNYWRQVVALKERAQEQAAEFDRQLGGFVLYPFVQGLRWQHGDIELESIGKGLRAAVDTTARRPELISTSAWNGVRMTTQHAVIRRRMPDPSPWFAAPVPRGTAYDAEERLDVLGPVPGTDRSVAVLRDRNPWAYGVVRLGILEGSKGERLPTVEKIRQAYGAMAEYNLSVMTWMAGVAAPRSGERERIQEGQCRLVADRCIALAYFLVALGRDDDAARALRRAFDGANDRVHVSNESEALVRYYHERGRQGEALRVAEHAAGTGSESGIETMARLLEWQGRFSEAEEQYLDAQRRYDDTDGVLAFYRRMVFEHREASYESKLERLSRDTFPQGFERLDLATLPVVPRDGVQIQEDSRLWDLRKNDVVLGLDAWRIHNAAQYSVIRRLDHRPEMRLHVWRQGRNLEVPVRALNRWLDTSFRDYP